MNKQLMLKNKEWYLAIVNNDISHVEWFANDFSLVRIKVQFWTIV